MTDTAAAAVMSNWPLLNMSPDPRTRILQEALGRITYKHGWTFRAYDQAPRAACTTPPTLEITLQAIDSTGRVQSGFELTHQFMLPLDVGYWPRHLEQMIEWVWQCIRSVEIHEAREFFKVDGVCYDDPHRDENAHLYE